MPIVGLTTGRSFGDGLPCLGHIRKGAPKADKRPGHDLDYFRVEFDPRYQYMAPVFAEMYGTEPVRFEHIFLAGGTPDDVFSAWKEEWTSATLVRRCDGQSIVRWFDGERYRDDVKPCECKVCKCKETGRLRIFMPEFLQAVTKRLGDDKAVFGYFSLTTTSKYDIVALSGYLNDVYALFKNLAGIEMTLGREKRKVSTKGPEGKPIRTERSLLYLNVSGKETAALIPALSAGRDNALMLPAGTVEPGFEPESEPEPELNTLPEWIAQITEFCDLRLSESAEQILTSLDMTWEMLAEKENPVDEFISLLIEAMIPVRFRQVEIKQREVKEGQNPLIVFDRFLGHRLMESRFDKFNNAEIDTSAWTAPGVYELPAEYGITLARLPREMRNEKNQDLLVIGQVERVG